MKWLLALVVSVQLSGCGIAYWNTRTKLLETATDKDYEPAPPANYQDVEKEYISGLLKDPGSAQFKFGELAKDAIPKEYMSMTPTPVLVMKHSVEVNAKNSFGGYVGFQTYTFAWREGKIYAMMAPGGDGYTWKYSQ